MGVVVDSNGYAWVSNSKWVVAPCPGVRPAKEVSESEPKGGGDVTLIKPERRDRAAEDRRRRARPTRGGSRSTATTTSGSPTSAGSGCRSSAGRRRRTARPASASTGAAISPASGYGFDGLVRNTGVIVDPSGNVWLANNWKNAPIQTNPGGYQIVAYLGLAAPIRSPAIGPPAAP